jgi:hypothetical protein
MTVKVDETVAVENATLKALLDAIVTDLTSIFAPLAGMLFGSATWDPGNLVDAAGETSASITVTGAALGDLVLCSFDKDLVGLMLTGYVSAADTVKLRLQNESASTLDLASGTARVWVLKAASFRAPAARQSALT